MILAFTLSMPNNNSWDGRWSGEGRLYVVTRTFTGAKGGKKAGEILSSRSYYYNFGDGWGASVSVKEVSPSEARQLRKKSNGFCGYDWMVDSIISHGKILNSLEEKKLLEGAAK